MVGDLHGADVPLALGLIPLVAQEPRFMGFRVSATPQHLHGIRGIDSLEPTQRVPHDCGGQIPIEVGKP